MLAEKQEVLINASGAVEPFNDFRSQLSILKEENAKTIFDYDSKVGNAAARSYVRKLATTAVAIDKRRKELGEESREYIKRVNAEGNQLEQEVRDMMKPHQEAIDAIEQKEKERVASIKARINFFKVRQECKGHDSAELRAGVEELEASVVDTSYQEFMAEATEERQKALDAHHNELVIASAREDEQRELAKLRAEAEERARLDREEAIRKEAEEKAKREAEARAEAERQRVEQERIASERREQELKEQAARAEREKQEAIEKAEREKREAGEKAEREKIAAVEAEQKRIAAEEKARADAEAAREADRKHQASIHNAIIEALSTYGVEDSQAKAIIVAIRKSEIPHVKIQY